MQSVISKARTIPPSFYTCSQHFKEEMRRIFYNNWVHLGRTDQVKNVGDRFVGKILEQPFLVTRTAQGIRAYDQMHRWTTPTKESKLLNRFEFDFKLDDSGLIPLPIHSVGPMLFLFFGNAVNTAKDSQLAQFNVDMKFDKMQYVTSKVYRLNCNWKVYVDNYLDGGYHVEHAHKDFTTQLNMKTYKTHVGERHVIQTCQTKRPAPNSDPATETYTWLYVYPNLMMSRYGKWMDTNTVIPIDAERCEVHYDYYHEGDTDQAALEAYEAEGNQVELEDEELCERVQEGMHSQFFKYGRYAPSVESAMYQFHDLLLKDLNQRYPATL